jgi:hypothetical protein
MSHPCIHLLAEELQYQPGLGWRGEILVNHRRRLHGSCISLGQRGSLLNLAQVYAASSYWGILSWVLEPVDKA